MPIASLHSRHAVDTCLQEESKDSTGTSKETGSVEDASGTSVLNWLGWLRTSASTSWVVLWWDWRSSAGWVDYDQKLGLV